MNAGQDRFWGLRGAVQAERNDSDAIVAASEELLRELMQRNELAPERMVSCLFTVTEDLDAEFPAVAARRVGLDSVPRPLLRTERPPASAHLSRRNTPPARGPRRGSVTLVATMEP